MKQFKEQNQYDKGRPEGITFTVPNALEESNARMINSNNKTIKVTKNAADHSPVIG